MPWPGLKPGRIAAAHLGWTNRGAMLWCRAGTRAGTGRSTGQGCQGWFVASALLGKHGKDLDRSWKDLRTFGMILKARLLSWPKSWKPHPWRRGPFGRLGSAVGTRWFLRQIWLLSAGERTFTMGFLQEWREWNHLKAIFTIFYNPWNTINTIIQDIYSHFSRLPEGFMEKIILKSGAATCIGPHPGFQRAWSWRHNT